MTLYKYETKLQCQLIIQVCVGAPLPRPLNDNGARIFLVNFEGDVGKGAYNIDDVHGVIFAMHEIIIMEDPYACINGITYIVDLNDINLKMTANFTPVFVNKLIKFLEKSLPLRIKGINMINAPKFFQNVANMFLSISSEKLRNRIHFYGSDFKELYNIIPKKYFPIELGGENGSRKQTVKDFDEKWLKYENYFKENLQYGTNELLRPGGLFDIDDLYGVKGTFRKLEVD